MQQVIESADIPNLSRTGYQVYQFPSRALLNPEKDASVLQDQEISIEPMRAVSPGELARGGQLYIYIYVIVWYGDWRCVTVIVSSDSLMVQTPHHVGGVLNRNGTQ